MNGDKRNFSLSIWDHNDNFLCLLKPSSGVLEGQSYNENLTRNIYGEETLSFTIPAYINEYKENDKWNYIFNEQKVRYIEYDDITNEPIENGIKEFVLKHYEESRNGYEKIIQCECESLAVYELSKVGWSINFDVGYIQQNEIEQNPDDYLTLDYWLKKIFYKETNLGRVSTTTEYSYLLQGLQLRDDEGFPIEKECSINDDGDYYFKRIDEPVWEDNFENVPEKYVNTNGWCWEVQAIDPRRLDQKIATSTLYEEPTIDRYIEVSPNNYLPYSYQKLIDNLTIRPFAAGTYHKGEYVLYKNTIYQVYYENTGILDAGVTITRIGALGLPPSKWIIIGSNIKNLLPFPIKEEDYNKLQYVTDIKRHLITCERSNIFSVIQTLCEEFKVWAYFTYNYNDQGKIIERKIIFKSEAVDDNVIFDFSYSKNLQSCSRVIDSNELVTKLIIPDSESSLDSNRILSIKQSVENPTGEGYIYNFDYFYNSGNLSRLTEEEKLGITSVTSHSDEYYINYHCGKVKNFNNDITKLQSYLVPLYQRKDELDGKLAVQQASITALQENIQTIQEKIDAIPENMQTIKSWSDDKNQQNHIGELKTLTTTTDNNGNSCLCINFNREDIIYSAEAITYPKYRINSNGEKITDGNIKVDRYTPRFFNKATWNPGTEILDDNDKFTILDNSIGTPIPSDINDIDVKFIKGFIFNSDFSNLGRTYVRVRYKYSPLYYYYYLIQEYWNKIDKINEDILILKQDLQQINNKIIVNENLLNNLLNDKNEEILQFEKKYSPFIRESYWETSDYQSQITSETLDTRKIDNIYEGIATVVKNLSTLNLNDSLHNFSYYIELSEPATNILIDTITMVTLNPVGSGEIAVPRYRGHDFEVFKKENRDIYILAISPELIDTYNKNGYNIETYYKSTIEYKTVSNNAIIERNKAWIYFEDEDNINIEEKYIYLSNDNILTDTLKVYSNNVNEDNKLELYTDYTYTYDYIGYNEQGQRVSLDEQTSYEENIKYDYILKITLNKTPLVNSSNKFIVKYSTENTLSYLYKDAINVSNDYSMPKITYSISMVDLSSLNEYKNYKPILGQKVPIFDPEMRLNGYEGIITSISKNLEHPEETQIELATYETKFEDIFQKLTATMTDVKYNQNELMAAANSFTPTGSIKTEVFQKSLNENTYQIQLGVNNDITIDKSSGITLVDQDSNSAVKIIGNGIFLTESYTGDESQWRTGITGEGINANALTAGNIDTKNINIWNSTEGQIRFIWNEQGIFSYGSAGTSGTDANNPKDFVNYNKFIKFNYDGLQFNDEGRSALSLGWDGLNINTQNNSLVLNAEKGLVLQEWLNGIAITRLELGKLDNGLIYGLRLNDTEGKPTFQSDSDGNLWLSKYIKVGGQYNATTGQYTSAPNAGIVGVTTANIKYQMGIVRNDSSGDPEWREGIIRFWAGPQTKEQYLNQLGMTSNDVSNISKWNQINDYDPALSRFKVDEYGNIIASGIDVGGWIGSGKILRSKNYEAILRSDGYTVEDPVIAIGKNNNNEDGTTHNFRVYQDGSLNIGNGNFTATSTGIVNASNLIINGGSISLGNGTFSVDDQGNLTASSVQIEGGGISGTGININNKFVVDGLTGSVIASDIVITGNNESTSNWIIDSDEFQVTKIGEIGAGIIPENKPISFSTDNYDFSVANGDIRFRGNIFAYYSGEWYEGLDDGIATITEGNVTTTFRIIKGLIVSRKYYY